MTENAQGPQGIRFNDHFFSEPQRFVEWVAPRCAGIFAILVHDANWAPKPFQPIWFGEFGNNAQHRFARNRPMQADSFYVSALPMPFSTTEQRCALRDRLIWAYNPVLNPEGTSPAVVSEWAYKLQEIEKNNAERFAEPQPPKRRRIGFLPDAEPAR